MNGKGSPLICCLKVYRSCVSCVHRLIDVQKYRRDRMSCEERREEKSFSENDLTCRLRENTCTDCYAKMQTTFSHNDFHVLSFSIFFLCTELLAYFLDDVCNPRLYPFAYARIAEERSFTMKTQAELHPRAIEFTGYATS